MSRARWAKGWTRLKCCARLSPRAPWARDGNHRRTGAGAPRHLRGGGGLSRFRRQHGPGDRDPHRGGEEWDAARPGGRRHRRRLGPGCGMAGNAQQGTRNPARRGNRLAGPGTGLARCPGSLIMLLLIDNYDSFTYNLAQYLGELGAEVKVLRNDAVDVAGIAALAPERIVISPGPCTPDEAGVSLAAVREFAGRIP